MALGSGIGSAIGGIGGGIAVLAGAAGDNGDKYRKEALKAWKKLKVSDFDFRALSAPELKLVAQAFPQVYNAIVPEEVQTIVEGPENRLAQARALGRTEEIARSGSGLIDRLGAQEAMQRLAAEGNAADEGVLRNMAARGQLGAGDELQARLVSSANQNNAAAQAAASMTRDAAMRRLAANEQAFGQAGQMRAADVGIQQANAGFVNNFNALAAQLQNQAAQQNAAARERAQAYNVGQKQGIANENEQARYTTALENLNRSNRLKAGNTDENIRITQGMTGVLSQLGQSADQQQANRAQAIVGLGQGIGGAAGGAFGF